MAAMSSAAPELSMGFFGACAFHEMSPLPGTPMQLPPQLHPGSGSLSAYESLHASKSRVRSLLGGASMRRRDAKAMSRVEEVTGDLHGPLQRV